MTIPPTLHELAEHYATDKATHGYCPVYERYFAPFRDERFNLLEIGVRRGASIKMWLDYFPNATVYGVDIECAHKVPNRDRWVFTLCDVADETRLLSSLGELDLRVVVDDGSHKATDIEHAFHALWPLVVPGGFYVIEDSFCQWWEEFRCEVNGPAILHRFVDHVNGDRSRCPTAVRDIEAVHYHSGLMFVEKKR